MTDMKKLAELSKVMSYYFNLIILTNFVALFIGRGTHQRSQSRTWNQQRQ